MEAVLLIGIQASGKSSFYNERFADTHVRVNLDTLKTRRREDLLLQACIDSHRSFVVDNTNVLVSERAKYIALGRSAGYDIIGYYFKTALKEALQRNQQRTGKEVIPEKGILAKYRAVEIPRYAEGFDKLFSVTIANGMGFIVKAWDEE